MTEEELKTQAEAEQSKLKDLSVPELIDIIKETRSEAKQRRLKEKELNERLEAIESEKAQREQDKKIAEGKKDEVIADLTKQLEDFKSKAGEWDKYNTAKRTEFKEKLGDNYLSSFDILPLADLESLVSKFNHNSTLPDSDNGAGAKRQPGKIEGLQKDLALAIQKRDLPAQIRIKEMIEQEKRKK